MIIPIRCFTCGKVIADKWEYYQRECEKLVKEGGEREGNKYFVQPQSKEILDKLGLDRYCCRRHMLGHVDIIDNL